MQRQRWWMMTLATALLSGSACGEQVFTNGISVNGQFVNDNGMIYLLAFTNRQTDVLIRDVAPSIGEGQVFDTLNTGERARIVAGYVQGEASAVVSEWRSSSAARSAPSRWGNRRRAADQGPGREPRCPRHARAQRDGSSAAQKACSGKA